MQTGLVLIECNEELTEEKVQLCVEAGINEFEVLFIDNVMVGSFLRDTLLVDKIGSPEEAIIEIYRRLRPGDPPSFDQAKGEMRRTIAKEVSDQLVQSLRAKAKIEVFGPKGKK